MVNEAKLDFWMQNNLNVLLRGTHGTGKSTMIIEAAERNGLKWMYFSASTMDVFTDFIGVPRVVTDENGGEYLGFVKPKRIAEDEVEFLFFDEFNRCKPKLLNSVMELIQFRSINGVPFKNLKMVWAAINPEESEDSDFSYHVETLDPAHIDRFHVIVDMDSTPSKKYFMEKLGDDGVIAVDWWMSLAPEFSKLISPRRLEYAIDMFHMGGDLKDVLPKKINVTQLVNQLKNGSFEGRLGKLFTLKNNELTKTALKNENFFIGAHKIIMKTQEWLDYFVFHYPSEKFNKELVANKKFREYVIRTLPLLTARVDDISDIIGSGTASEGILEQLRGAILSNGLQLSDNLDMVLSLYPTANHLANVEDRKSATLLMKNADFSKSSSKNVIAAMHLNCIIGALTFSTLWVDTIGIFKRIEEYCDKNDMEFSKIYSVVKNDFIKGRVQVDVDKLTRRLEKAGFNLN